MQIGKFAKQLDILRKQDKTTLAGFHRLAVTPFPFKSDGETQLRPSIPGSNPPRRFERRFRLRHPPHTLQSQSEINPEVWEIRMLRNRPIEALHRLGKRTALQGQNSQPIIGNTMMGIKRERLLVQGYRSRRIPLVECFLGRRKELFNDMS